MSAGRGSDSATVRRALASVPSGDLIFAIGANFTVEALNLLAERGARVARLGQFH